MVSVLASGFEQQLHERDRFVPGVFHLAALAKPEEFFKLVDDDKKVLVLGKLRQFDCVDQAQGAAAKLRLNRHSRGLGSFARYSENSGRREGVEQTLDGIIPGTKRRHAPVRPGL